MNSLKHLRVPLSLLGGAVLLAACGGGGGGNAPIDPPAAGSDVPQSALSSSAGAFTFVKSVAAAKDESATPIVVGDVTLATSETDEPDPGV